MSHTYSLANGSERPELSSPKTNVYLFCDIDNAMYMHTAGWSHLPSKYNLKCDTFLAETWPGRRGPEAGSTDNKSKGLISTLSIYIYLYLFISSSTYIYSHVLLRVVDGCWRRQGGQLRVQDLV